MDCFFVSVSLKSRPELIGQPVVVSHGSKTGASGEISCASYEARQCGVRAGMFMERVIHCNLLMYLVCFPADLCFILSSRSIGLGIVPKSSSATIRVQVV